MRRTRQNEPTQDKILKIDKEKWFSYEQIQERTGMARGTVAEALRCLIRDGAVKKLEFNDGKRGRPVSLFMVV